MTVKTTADVHFDEKDVWHRWNPDAEYGAYGVLKFGASGANIYFGKPAQIDAVIAELVALRADMTGEAAAAPGASITAGTPVVVTGDNPPRNAVGSEQCCTADGYEDAASGYVCTAQDGHDGPDHIAYKPGGGEYHRWPVTDGTPLLVDDGDRCECSHPQDVHAEDSARQECLSGGCGCTVFRLAAPKAEPEPGPYDRAIQQAEFFARPGNMIDDERAVAGGTAVKYRLGCGCVIGLSAGWPAGTEVECIGHGKTAIEAATAVSA